jgi:hypothetical protein
MLVLGAIYTAGSMAASLLGSLMAGPGTPPAADAQMPQLDPRSIAILLLHAPLVVLFWHAPALVHWHGVTPVKSLFFSAVACFRNLGAMLVFGAGWLAVFLVAGFIVSTIGAMLGGLAVARGIMTPTALLLVAMFTTSVYFTFRDSFRADGEEEVPPLPAPGGESTP